MATSFDFHDDQENFAAAPPAFEDLGEILAPIEVTLDDEFTEDEEEDVSNVMLTEYDLACRTYSCVPCMAIRRQISRVGKVGKCGSISLSKRGLGLPSIKAVSAALAFHPNLTHLSLTDIEMNGEGLSSLMGCLRKLSSLEYLDLSGNPFGAPQKNVRVQTRRLEADSSPGGRRRSAPTPDALDLVFAKIGRFGSSNEPISGATGGLDFENGLYGRGAGDLESSTYGDSVSEALSGFLHNSRLTTLKLSSCRLRDTHTKVLLQAFPGTLTDLDLSGNFIGDELGGKHLTDFLTHNYTLKTINLSKNCIRGSSAIDVIKGLTANQGLVEADLSWNGIGDDEKTVVGLFSTNTVLQCFKASHTRIGQQLEKIAASFSSNFSLEILELSHSGCFPSAVLSLLQVLRVSSDSPFHTLEIAELPRVRDLEETARGRGILLKSLENPTGM